MQYLYNLLLAIDQFLNTLLLGHPDETISSRLGRAKGKERYFFVAPLRVLIDTLFWFDYELYDDGHTARHCEKSVMPLEQQNFRTVVDYEIWSWQKDK